VEKETGKDEEEGEDRTLEHPGGDGHVDHAPHYHYSYLLG